MVYTEVKKRNKKTYYYRTSSVRQGTNIRKKRTYLGVNLSLLQLQKKEREADIQTSQKKHSSQLSLLTSRILKVLAKYNITRAGLVGSYARGQQTQKSDIDIVIEPPEGIGFGFVGIAYELEKALRKKVDLLTYTGLSPHFRKSILQDEVRLL